MVGREAASVGPGRVRQRWREPLQDRFWANHWVGVIWQMRRNSRWKLDLVLNPLSYSALVTGCPARNRWQACSMRKRLT